MNLRESLHKELINVYNSKTETVEDRYNKVFEGITFTNENEIEMLGNFILNEAFKSERLEEGVLEEGIFDFFGNLIGGLGGNVTEQLKEWLIGKLMDWFVKPFLGKIGGADGQMYEEIKRYVQVTFAEMPFTEIVSTVTDCDKMTRLMTYGLFEYLLNKMLLSLNLDGIIVDTIRQELDKTFIEQSAIANKIATIVGDTVCGNADKIKSNLADIDFSFR